MRVYLDKCCWVYGVWISIIKPADGSCTSPTKHNFVLCCRSNHGIQTKCFPSMDWIACISPRNENDLCWCNCFLYLSCRGNRFHRFANIQWNDIAGSVISKCLHLTWCFLIIWCCPKVHQRRSFHLWIYKAHDCLDKCWLADVGSVLNLTTEEQDSSSQQQLTKQSCRCC